MRWPWARPNRITESEGRRQEVLHLISKRLKECEEALARDSKDVDALFTKAVFLARIAEYWRALECLERVTALNPRYPGVWHLKSSLYRRVGDFTRARACREKALAQ